MTEKALESKLVGRVTGSINGGCVQPLASPRIELRQTDNKRRKTCNCEVILVRFSALIRRKRQSHLHYPPIVLLVFQP